MLDELKRKALNDPVYKSLLNENEKFINILIWAISEEALEKSLRLPKGSSRMNGPERMTAEICIQNLQVEIRKKMKEKQ